MILGQFKIGMKLHRQTSRVMSWFLAPLHCPYMNQHNLVLDHASLRSCNVQHIALNPSMKINVNAFRECKRGLSA